VARRPSRRRPLRRPHCLPGDALLRYTLSKYAATEAALEAGIPCPRTIFIAANMPDGDLRAALRDFSFPGILKSDNAFHSAGEYRKGRTYAVRTLREAEYLLPDLRVGGARLMVQEKVPGFGIGCFLLRHQGRVLLRFAHRRLHEVPYTAATPRCVSARRIRRPSRRVSGCWTILDTRA